MNYKIDGQVFDDNDMVNREIWGTIERGEGGNEGVWLFGLRSHPIQFRTLFQGYCGAVNWSWELAGARGVRRINLCKAESRCQYSTLPIRDLRESWSLKGSLALPRVLFSFPPLFQQPLPLIIIHCAHISCSFVSFIFVFSVKLHSSLSYPI